MLHTCEIIKAVEAEFDRIDIPEKKFHSDHEAWAVLLEEIEELSSESRLVKHHSEYLKAKIFLDSDDKSKLESLDHIYEHAVLAAAEAVQVAAVATKFIKKERASSKVTKWQKIIMRYALSRNQRRKRRRGKRTDGKINQIDSVITQESHTQKGMKSFLEVD